MEENCYYLDRYPLREHYKACHDYMRHKTGWDEISYRIETSAYGVYFFDVSDAVRLFPRLDLDENYALICYASKEYHGICGEIAAVHKECNGEPVIKTEWLPLARTLGGIHYELPETAAPPMEAIYNDGTPEGYFEALLCQKFLTALPYACFERENWDIYMIEPPKEPDQWDVRLDIRDWRPRVYFYNGKPSTVVAWKRRIENGLGSSSGRDEVFLTEYHFQHDLGTSHMIQRWQGSWRKIKGEISDDSRYTDRRHCCVAGSSSVLIATEKTNSGHPWKLYHVLKELYG